MISDFSTIKFHLGQKLKSRADWATLWVQNSGCRSISLLQIIPKKIALGGGSGREAHHVEDAVFSFIKRMTFLGGDAVIFVT